MSASKGVLFEALLNDKTGDSRQVVGPLAPADALYPEVEQAFVRVSRLGQYSQEQLNQTERWAIHTAYQISEPLLAAATGVPSLEVFSGIPNTFIYNVQEGETPLDVAGHFVETEYVDFAYPLVPLHYTLRAAGDSAGTPNDPLLPNQWHLINTGQEVGNPDDLPIFGSWGEDIQVEPVWDQFTGDGVVIGIVDDGVQVSHPDLAPNVDLALSKDFDGRDNDPSPNTNSDFHGTAVAGVAAGAGNNGQGITGVAFDATIAGIRVVSRTDVTDEDIFRALNHLNNEIDIYNNSFGPDDDIRNVDAFGPMATQALRLSAFLGRNGLGNINVVAAGNGAAPDVFDNSNFDGFANNRFSIAVGAVGHDGIATDYSEGGSNVFVVAPSGTQDTAVVGTDFTVGSGLTTTDLVGDAGYNATGIFNDQIGRDYLSDVNYTSRFNGTSAAAPIVSGVVALMLEANPNLTYRDVEHILARSARQNSPTDLTWIANWEGLFVDPAVDPMTGFPVIFTPDDPAMPMMWSTEKYREADNSFLPLAPVASALPDVVPRVSNSLGYLPLLTNSAGFTVHDAEDYAYGHGVVDARLAVELARNWRRMPAEAAIINPRVLLSQRAGTIAGSFQIPNTQITVPGGISPPQNAQTEEFYDLWWSAPDADAGEPPDDPPINGRGFDIPIFVPDTLSVEWVEVELTFRDLPQELSDNLRITLVSPEGTHSDFVNWVPEQVTRPAWNPVPGDPMDPAQADTCAAAPDSIFCPSSATEFTWVFTTMRHWGERTGTDLVSEDGLPQTWRLVFENWNSSEANLESYKVDFYGTRVPEARIQGIVGLDTNGDEDFNFTGLINFDTGDFVRDIVNEQPEAFQFQPDLNREPLASEAIVYVDVDLDGSRDADEPFVMTGADGNFYFDLPFGTHTIRIEPPPGTTVVGDNSYTVQLGLDAATGEVVTRARDRNFLVAPAPITFEGTVFADFNGNRQVDLVDAGVRNFAVFADTNENGILDFVDNNFNFRFDPDVDVPIDPVAVSGPGGQYSLTVDTTSPGFVGSDFYTVMLAPRDGWEPTEPVRPFYRLFARSGATVGDLDFLAHPEVSVVAGTVFNDVNQNGLREVTESGLAGFRVFLDLDNDGALGLGEPSAVTGFTGTYSFTDLEPGNYTVRLVQTPAWKQIAPANVGGHSFDLLAAAFFTGQDFALTNIATYDFGNAPSPYPTTLAQDGARHKILNDFFLGDGVDGEVDGMPGQPSATGDDDGVEFVGGPELEPGTTQTILVTANRAGGYLQASIDFNRDGDWDDPGERVITNRLLPAGVTTIHLSVPESAVAGTTYARFRYGPFGIDGVRGEAAMGEVEDYALEVIGEPPHPADVNGDGVVSRADSDVIRDNLGTTEGATREMGDIDGDGDVDGDDLLDWQLAFAGGFTFGAANAAPPATLQENRVQELDAASLPSLEDAGIDGRAGTSQQFLTSRARDAVRFGLALQTFNGPEVAALPAMAAGASSVDFDASVDVPQASSTSTSTGTERDVVLASLEGRISDEIGDQTTSSMGGYLRPLSPDHVDAALALGLRDENDWLG